MLASLLFATALVVAAPQASCPDDTQPPVTMDAGLVLCATGVPLPLDPEGETGVRIGALDPAHPLARHGMRAGDVLFLIDNERARTGAEAAPRIKSALGPRDVLINFRRNGLPLLIRTGQPAD